MSKLKSRKLWFFVVAFGVGTALLVSGYIVGEVWSTFSGLCLMAYAGGNVGEHFANKP